MFIYDNNFLTEDEIKEVEKNYFDPSIPWTYFPGTQSDPGHVQYFQNSIHLVDIKTQDAPYFACCPILNNEDNIYNLNPIFRLLIEKFCQKHKVAYSKISRLKFNIIPRVDHVEHLYPHVDDMEDHYVFLYYVNDSDGDTVIFNEKSDNIKKFKYEELTIMEKITPKRGAAFLMNGKYFHAMSAPNKTNLRCVINGNIL